jgi:hypothetical protein
MRGEKRGIMASGTGGLQRCFVPGGPLFLASMAAGMAGFGIPGPVRTWPAVMQGT